MKIKIFYKDSEKEAYSFETQLGLKPVLELALDTGANLKGIDLSGMYIVGADVEGANFTGSRFINTKFICCNLIECDFVDCELEGCEFIECDRTDADFSGSNTEMALFCHSNHKGHELADRETPGIAKSIHRRALIGGLFDMTIELYEIVNKSCDDLQSAEYFCSFNSRNDLLAIPCSNGIPHDWWLEASDKWCKVALSELAVQENVKRVGLELKRIYELSEMNQSRCGNMSHFFAEKYNDEYIKREETNGSKNGK